MNGILIFLVLLMINLQASAKNIDGLDLKQVNDFNLCLNQQGFNFAQINQWENNAEMMASIPEEWPLYHNFKIYQDELASRDHLTFSNAIIASAIFYVSGEHTFENSIIANTTFVGDYNKLNFKNSCLVNVKFHKASFFTLLKIKRNSSFYKNITD